MVCMLGTLKWVAAGASHLPGMFFCGSSVWWDFDDFGSAVRGILDNKKRVMTKTKNPSNPTFRRVLLLRPFFFPQMINKTMAVKRVEKNTKKPENGDSQPFPAKANKVETL